MALVRSIMFLSAAMATLIGWSSYAGVIYNDTFQTYPAQNPAPNPLTNGPAGGQWYFVDPTPPTIAANEHRIYDSGTGGSALQSRVWISNGNGAGITNAITIPALPQGTNQYTFTLAFLAATDTTTAGRTATFRYDIGCSGGALEFVSGGDLSGSQIFSSLSGYGTAPEGAIGKADSRKFQVVFTATNITATDKIFVGLTRITNSGAAGAFIAMDDVSLSLFFPAPVAIQDPMSASVVAGDSVTFSGAFTNFPDSYQWYKDGEAIAGATATTYTIPFVTKPDEGSYVLWATNSAGEGATAAATLTVTDTTKPTLASAVGVLTLQHAQIRFSEPVDEASATNTSNYGVSGSVTVNSVRMADRFTTELFTTDLNPGATHTVTVSGVQDLGGNTILPDSTINLTVPALVVSSVAYNAGTTTTHPGGPPDPISAAGGYWMMTTNANIGLETNAVPDDNLSGFNAWQVSDNNTGTGTGIIDYRIAIDPASDDLARANGWRLLVHSRMVADFGGSTAPVVLYSHPAVPRRYGIAFDLDELGNLTALLLGGGTYVLPGVPTDYHTHMIVFDPATTNAAYYCDGQFIAGDYAGENNSAYNGLTFGTGASTGSGAMNFNRVQLDAVNGGQPVVVTQPQSTTNGVGQKVTFTAAFTPFVGAYQWLSNGIIIPGAISNSYTTDFITMADNGTQYKCRALHALGNVETLAATLTVTTDTTPPTVANAKGSMLLDRVTITFSEPVQELYATNVANYVWVNPGVTSVSAKMLDVFTVELRSTPQEPGSNYTVKVSNVRDTSNLVIANNTPAAFTTPMLDLVARYDAGNTTSQPAGPPDPTSVAGGSWLHVMGTDAGLTTNAVVDDLGTGLHAWQISDATTAASQFIQYNWPLMADETAAMRANGWVLTIRSRFVTDYGYAASIMAQFGDALYNRHLLWFNLDNAGDLLMELENGGNWVLTTGGIGTSDYHLHQVAYDPATTNAAYYFDGELVNAAWSGAASVYTYPGIQWGTGRGAEEGAMNVNLVEFEAVPALHLSAVLNGSNIEVSYTGILEAASAMSATPAWTPVATNSTSGIQVYSVPATGQQFFRSRRAN